MVFWQGIDFGLKDWKIEEVKIGIQSGTTPEDYDSET
jgi:hypothetical protein